MFKRSSTIPQRNKFCVTKDQMINDIDGICRNEEQRNMLYLCLDEAPPKEHRFEKIEEFLKGTQDLEKNSNMLASLKSEMENLQQDIDLKINTLRKVAGNGLRGGEIH
jgi:lipid II:glycine glycyltransferase (peptidoglycan interpeptide bridge formation enzyme)